MVTKKKTPAKKTAYKKKAAKKKPVKDEVPSHKFVKRLEKLLQKEDLGEMAEKSGVPKTTLSDWKLKNVPISVTRAIEILKAYDIKIELKEKK